MKTVFILLCSIAVLFSACAQMSDKNQVEKSSSTTISINLNNSFTTKPSAQNGADLQGMPNFVTERDYGAYCSLLSTYRNMLPENFVAYEALSGFGEFYNFQTLKLYLDEGVIPEYSYGLKSQNGEIFKITITEGVSSLGAGAGSQVTQLQDDDLRTIDMIGLTDGTKHIRINDVLYVYQKGNLSYIEWEQNGLIFTLRSIPVSNVVSPWTVEGSSPVLRDLLSADTAEAAMQSFKASMESAAVK